MSEISKFGSRTSSNVKTFDSMDNNVCDDSKKEQMVADILK